MIVIEEIWKLVEYGDIKPGMYEVSNFGRFRNIYTHKLLTPCLSEKGYLMVYVMCTNNKGRSIKLHRIVAVHFVEGRTKEKCEVDHVDGNKLNCRADNLEWVTHLENIRRAYKHNLVPIMKGELNGNSMLKDWEVHEICKLLVEHNGNCQLVWKIVRERITCNLGIIRGIKYKKSYTFISDKYFPKNAFTKYERFNDYRNYQS